MSDAASIVCVLVVFGIIGVIGYMVIVAPSRDQEKAREASLAHDLKLLKGYRDTQPRPPFDTVAVEAKSAALLGMLDRLEGRAPSDEALDAMVAELEAITPPA